MLKFKTPEQIDLENEYEIENKLNQLINKVLKNGHKQLILNEYDYKVFIKPNLSVKMNMEWEIKEYKDQQYSFIEELNKSGWNVDITSKQKEDFYFDGVETKVDKMINEYVVTFIRKE